MSLEHAKRLPPGQRARADFPRFGLPRYASYKLPSDVSRGLRVVSSGLNLTFLPEELHAVPRHEAVTSLHCVTTWSAVGLYWGGYRFRDVFERLIEPQIHTSGQWIVFKGLDGYQSGLQLSDALAESVMLADSLHGKPLTFEHGSPWRLVAPDHYGYKNVKHLFAIEFCQEFRPGPGPNEHPRARVRLEERGRYGPGWVLRHLYRPLVSGVVDAMARQGS